MKHRIIISLFKKENVCKIQRLICSGIHNFPFDTG